MSGEKLIRWSGLALLAGGITLAFYMLLHPYAELAGEHAAMRPTWIPAHSLHFIAALLMLFGLIGLYARHSERAGLFGLAGFVLATIGTAMFVGTGMITAFIWPVVARYSPTFVAADGPMFREPLTSWTTNGTYFVLDLGWVIFGIAMLRAGVLPRAAGILIIGGVLLFGSPVEPVGPLPWIVRVVGALVFGVGLVWVGWTLWSYRDVAERDSRSTEIAPKPNTP